MSKIVRKQLDSIVKLLEKANQLLYRELHTSPIDEQGIIQLATSSQKGAITLGEKIEKVYGTGKQSISILEQYCENLYLLTISLQDADRMRKLCDTLNQQIQSLRDVMDTELPNKLEVVFFPYKVSMWDSLESVYLAAKEDEDCEVYCVPIPYFDRNSDYSFGQLHYEGEDYPKNIEIINWQDYDIEERRPDVIYIHNPYDDRNFVTSVLPGYYSSELKKYTDCLVYIPYCVYDEPKSSTDQKTLEFFERYITPVMFHADQIVFQSENFSEVFIKTISSCTNISESIWKDKILSLGSPKYDKASSTIAEIRMNEEWKNKIFSDDGTKKKVVFYNTSLNMLLKHNEKMLDKIDSVIAYFEKHKDKYVLLWRPHPLIEATIEAMRPNLWKKFQHIVEEFKRKDIGIYDDTPDYGTGFALSDAYYGDFSSLVQLYQVSGKLLLQQDVRVKDYCNSLDYAISNNMYFDGEYIWATAMNYNGVYRIDPVDFHAEYMGAFPDVDLNGYCLYFGIVEKGDKLYFCPAKAESIGVLDKKTLQLSSVKVDCKNPSVTNDYYGISLFHENVIMTGRGNNTILILNTNTLKLNYVNVCELFPRAVLGENDIMVRHLCECENMLYTISPAHKALLRFDPIVGTGEILSLKDDLIDSEQLGIDVLYSDGKSLWFIQPYREYVLRLDSETGKVIQNIEFAKSARFVCVGQFVYLFSHERDICYKIDINTYEYTMVNVGVKAEYAFKFDDKIILSNSFEKEITILNTATFEYIKTPIWSGFTNSGLYNISQMFRSYEKQYDYTRESAFYNLELLMEGIHTGSTNVVSETDEPIGTQIHKTIKEKMK